MAHIDSDHPMWTSVPARPAEELFIVAGNWDDNRSNSLLSIHPIRPLGVQSEPSGYAHRHLRFCRPWKRNTNPTAIGLVVFRGHDRVLLVLRSQFPLPKTGFVGGRYCLRGKLPSARLGRNGERSPKILGGRVVSL